MKMPKKYIDSRGWKYRVMSSFVDNRFKARYQKPEKSGDVGWKGLASVPWRETFDEAQAIGIKETIAMDLEKYGDVRVAKVDVREPEQLTLMGAVP